MLCSSIPKIFYVNHNGMVKQSGNRPEKKKVKEMPRLVLIHAVSLLLLLLGMNCFTTAGTTIVSSNAPPTKNTTGNGWKAYCEGQCNPVGNMTKAPVYGGGSVFMGGGTDVTDAFKQQIQWLSGGDFLILRSDDDNGYNDWIYTTLGGVRSVTSLIVFTKEAANDPQAVAFLAAADAIFIAGGDQSQYYAFWQGTAIQTELDKARGRSSIGGTSAGCMVLSNHVYTASDPNGGDLSSKTALRDPYNDAVTIAPGFINLTNVNAHVILDTHFKVRDRFGRLLTFVSRLSVDYGLPAYGIGLDEQAAFVVSADGRNATLVGQGHAWVIYGTKKPIRCEPGHSLSTETLTVQKLVTGDTFDLMSLMGGTSSNQYTVYADSGELSTSDPYSPNRRTF